MVATRDGLNNFVKVFTEYSASYRKDYLPASESARSTNSKPWNRFIDNFWQGTPAVPKVIESGDTLQAKQALIEAGKKIGLDDKLIQISIEQVASKTREFQQVSTDDIKFRDTNSGKDMTLTEALLISSKNIGVLEGAAKIKIAQEAAREARLAEERRQFAIAETNKSAMDSYSAVAEAILKGRAIDINSTAGRDEKAISQVAKGVMEWVADLSPEKRSELFTKLKLPQDTDINLLSDDDRIKDRGLLVKLVKEFQKENGIAVDGKVFTASFANLLINKGVTDIRDTGILSTSVTQSVGDLGGKNNSYELLNYTGDDAKQIAGKNATEAAKNILDKLGVDIPADRVTGNVAEDMKERVKIFQRSQGLNDDGVIGKKTAVALEIANLHSLVGGGKPVSEPEPQPTLPVRGRELLAAK